MRIRSIVGFSNGAAFFAASCGASSPDTLVQQGVPAPLQAREIVGRAIAAEGCGAVVINGFSNGAAFAAALFCGGETFGGVVRGSVIDDPVTDTATAGCDPAANVDVVMYWTTAVAQPAGTDCASIDWTCAGGTLVDVDTYASRTGTGVTPSPNTSHEWYWDAPEVFGFLS